MTDASAAPSAAERQPDADWELIHLLGDPQRRAVYRLVRSADEPMTRDAVAAALGVSRPLAVFHLDRLADAGLLRVSYARPPGRGGRGAGRPSKRYEAADVEVSVGVPERRYDLAAVLLARALAEMPTDDATTFAVELAQREGYALGFRHRPSGRQGVQRSLECAAEVLSNLGYESQRNEPKQIRLSNCPFHLVAQEAPETMCLMNQRFVQGILDGLGAPPQIRAAGDGAHGDCCVTIAPR